MNERDHLSARASALRAAKQQISREIAAVKARLRNLGPVEQELLTLEEPKPTLVQQKTEAVLRELLGAPTAAPVEPESPAPVQEPISPLHALTMALDGEWRSRGELEKRCDDAARSQVEQAFARLMPQLIANGISEANDGQKRAKKYRRRAAS